VLTEVTPFFKDRAFVGESYSALRGLVNPSGRLEENGITRAPDAPSEPMQALSIAIAMKSAGEQFFRGDARYLRLAQWVSQHLVLSELSAHDVAFAAEVVA